jgi:hypothetical protein
MIKSKLVRSKEVKKEIKPLSFPIKPLSFPKLMKYNQKNRFEGMVVLFLSPKVGTVVVSSNYSYPTGDFSDDWQANLFEDLNEEETVELFNREEI